MSTFLLLEVFIKVATVPRGKQCSAFMRFSTLLRAYSLAVVQWRSQTNYRILEEVHRMYLNALDNQVNLYSEMISLNYLPDNVPLDAGEVYPRIKQFTNFNFKPGSEQGTNSNTDNFVVSNCDLPKGI